MKLRKSFAAAGLGALSTSMYLLVSMMLFSSKKLNATGAPVFCIASTVDVERKISRAAWPALSCCPASCWDAVIVAPSPRSFIHCVSMIPALSSWVTATLAPPGRLRSEERRVGKEGRGEEGGLGSQV